MNTQIEKEYKILINEKQYLYFINELYPQITPIKQVNTYYDTEDHFLEKKKIALRIRKINNRKIVTIKYYNDKDLIEMEKEVFCEDAFTEDFSVRETLKKLQIVDKLIPKVTVTTYRTLIQGEYAELCIDKNFYDDQSIDYEIEYEVKKEHHSLEVFQDILNKINVHYIENCESKLSRALKRR